MTDDVLLERHGDVAVLRLNDPKTLNAMNPEMARAISDHLGRPPSGTRAIMLAGSERAFCAGANLWSGDHFDLDAPDFDAGAWLETLFNPMMRAFKECDVPIVSAVCGAAAGVGASVALAADLVVAGRGAYFMQAFSRVGLSPDSGVPYLLARSVGRARAMELLLLADKLPAQTALDWGLITRVVDDAEVETAALALATRLAQGPTRSLALTRKSVWAGSELTWEEELRLEAVRQTEAGKTQDFREGMAAFAEGRKARFTGS